MAFAGLFSLFSIFSVRLQVGITVDRHVIYSGFVVTSMIRTGDVGFLGAV